MIPGLKEVLYEIRLKRLKLWTLENRRVHADLIEVFKMFRGLSVVDIDTFFELDKYSRTRGHMIRYDTIEEFNVDSKAEYSALSITRSQKKN